MTTNLNLRLPEGLINAVDTARGDVPRSKFMTRLATWVLEAIPNKARQSHLRAAWETRPTPMGSVVLEAIEPATVGVLAITISDELVEMIEHRFDDVEANTAKRPTVNGWWTDMLTWSFTRLPHEAHRLGLTTESPTTIGVSK